eukprot:5667481-Prymnesium_polylepis.1
MVHSARRTAAWSAANSTVYFPNRKPLGPPRTAKLRASFCNFCAITNLGPDLGSALGLKVHARQAATRSLFSQTAISSRKRSPIAGGSTKKCFPWYGCARYRTLCLGDESVNWRQMGEKNSFKEGSSSGGRSAPSVHV